MSVLPHVFSLPNRKLVWSPTPTKILISRWQINCWMYISNKKYASVFAVWQLHKKRLSPVRIPWSENKAGTKVAEWEISRLKCSLWTIEFHNFVKFVLSLLFPQRISPSAADILKFTKHFFYCHGNCSASSTSNFLYIAV